MATNRVPPALQHVLEWDKRITDQTVRWAHKLYPPLKTQTWKSIFKVLEISCHGIPWLGLTLISIYMFKTGRTTQINLMAALIYDIIMIAITKAITRRTRPQVPDPQEKMFFTRGPDKFSFPSGHASRAILLTLFFYSVSECYLVLLVVGLWAASICASRILMRRHHVVDVAAGVAFGVLEYALVRALWVGDETSKWVGGWIAGAEDEFDGS